MIYPTPFKGVGYIIIGNINNPKLHGNVICLRVDPSFRAATSLLPTLVQRYRNFLEISISFYTILTKIAKAREPTSWVLSEDFR